MAGKQPLCRGRQTAGRPRRSPLFGETFRLTTCLLRLGILRLEGFKDGELVYENKVVWFLNDRVLAREIRASRYTKARTTADGAPVRQTLGMSAVKSYVAAIVDL
jgi:hypothetical protein